MSHYTGVQTEFRSQEALIEALVTCGFARDQIEIHDKPAQLFDYQDKPTAYQGKTGDARFAGGDKAHVIVRRKYMGHLQNDFGVYLDGDKSVVFLCDFARDAKGKYVNNPQAKEHGYGRWFKRLKQEYAVACASAHAKKVGKKLHRVNDGAKIRLYLGA